MADQYLISTPSVENCGKTGYNGAFLFKERGYGREFYVLKKDEKKEWWAIGIIADFGEIRKPIVVSDSRENVTIICPQVTGINNKSADVYEISYKGVKLFCNGDVPGCTEYDIAIGQTIPFTNTKYSDDEEAYKKAADELIESYVTGGGTIPDSSYLYKTSWVQRKISDVWQKTFAFAHAKTVYTDYANKKTLYTTLKEMKESIDGKIEIVDSAINNYSPNPVQNRVIKVALDEKAPLDNPVFTGSISLNRKSSTDIGNSSFAVGKEVTASGSVSHAEGAQTQAIGDACHAEGSGTVAEGTATHAEGMFSKASNAFSHAEGMSCVSSNGGAHAEGVGSVASGNCSHSEGYHTESASDYQHVQGKYNVTDTENKYAHIVGGGSNDENRKNIHTIDWDGNAEYSGDVLCRDQLGFPVRLSWATFSHNIPRPTPKDITSYVADGTLWQRLDGTNGFSLFEDIYVGDYIKMSRAITCPNSTDGTVGSQYVTIAGIDTLWGNGDNITMAYHHLVMVPGQGFGGRQHFGRHAMNGSNTTSGGYAGSVMNTSVLGAVVSEGSTASGATINQQLYAEFGSHLKTTRELVSISINETGINRFGSATGCSSNWAWGSYQSILMSEIETYGSIVWSSSGYDTGNAKMQMPLFANSREAMNNKSAWYFLKDVASASLFCYSSSNGHASYDDAGGAWDCVRPRFVIAA